VNAERLVLWDFDGTLAFRPGLWGGCALEVLNAHDPGHGIELERLRTAFRGGFPWHAWEKPHLHLGEAEAWWEHVSLRITQAFADAGVEHGSGEDLAVAFRERYTDAAIGWQRFEDALPALEAVAAAGWRSAVLSNHVPELEALVAGLGLGEHLDAVFNSAQIGYEKPHPEAFRIALNAFGAPREAWMVGDNEQADVEGAREAGMRAILVRGDGDAPGLLDAVAAILGSKTL
jgi:putative hydrolase of the HAD superfamily